MPVHDWSRVDANIFHHFHRVWTDKIASTLNAGLLPTGYSALIERHAPGITPDALALEWRSQPPSVVFNRAASGVLSNADLLGRCPQPTGGMLTATPPKTRLVRQAKSALTARANQVVIRHRLSEMVCIIEIVSPGNKRGRAALRSFVKKAIDCLQPGIHLLIIDILPPTPRDPQGMHKAIWDEIEDEPFELPPDKPFTLSAYVAGDLLTDSETTAYVEMIGVGDILPDMPAYLDRSNYVPVPLEATYQAAWATCPAAFRELVETGRLAGEDA